MNSTTKSAPESKPEPKPLDDDHLHPIGCDCEPCEREADEREARGGDAAPPSTSHPKAVVAVIRGRGVHAHQVLAVTRPDSQLLAFPGGRVEPGESLRQAVVRETEEETGLIVLDSEFIFELGVSPALAAQEPAKGVRYDVSAFAVSAYSWEGQPVSREPGVSVRWATPEEMLGPMAAFPDFNKVALGMAK